jgi:hypothetical protein
LPLSDLGAYSGQGLTVLHDSVSTASKECFELLLRRAVCAGWCVHAPPRLLCSITLHPLECPLEGRYSGAPSALSSRTGALQWSTPPECSRTLTSLHLTPAVALRRGRTWLRSAVALGRTWAFSSATYTLSKCPVSALETLRSKLRATAHASCARPCAAVTHLLEAS